MALEDYEKIEIYSNETKDNSKLIYAFNILNLIIIYLCLIYNPLKIAFEINSMRSLELFFLIYLLISIILKFLLYKNYFQKDFVCDKVIIK